jgi:DNA-binding GntR family transcriptional regulator
VQFHFANIRYWHLADIASTLHMSAIGGTADMAVCAAAHLLSPVLAMEAALKRQDLDSWAAADGVFHRTLVGLTRNTRLSQRADQFYDQTVRARLLTLRLRPLPAIELTKGHSILHSDKTKFPFPINMDGKRDLSE